MKVYSYGKSMYGGWYINYINGFGKPAGEHFKTLKELKEWAKKRKLELIGRFDN